MYTVNEVIYMHGYIFGMYSPEDFTFDMISSEYHGKLSLDWYDGLWQATHDKFYYNLTLIDLVLLIA